MNTEHFTVISALIRIFNFRSHNTCPPVIPGPALLVLVAKLVTCVREQQARGRRGQCVCESEYALWCFLSISLFEQLHSTELQLVGCLG